MATVGVKGGAFQGDSGTKVGGREQSHTRINNVSQVLSLRSLKNHHKTKKEREICEHPRPAMDRLERVTSSGTFIGRCDKLVQKQLPQRG